MEKPSDKSEGFFIGIPPFATAKDSCFFNYNGIFTATITAGGPTTYCIGDSVQLCANNITGASYFWSTGERTECIYAHAGGVYSVIVNAPVDCPPDTATITITVDTTCCGNPLSEIDTVQIGTYTGNLNQNNNTRIAASKVTYNHLDLAIAPNKKIVVPSGDTLEILNSHLYACGDRWQGIIVEQGGMLIIDSSLIEDAITAVKDSGNLHVSIKSSTFDNNLTDIYLHDGNFGGAVIKGNHFLYTTVSAAYDVDMPDYHIRLKALTTVTIGGGTTLAEQNEFKWKKYGIFADRASTLKVYNSKFIECGREELNLPVGFPYDGAGIYAAGVKSGVYYLNVSDNNGASKPNYFEGCVNGVFVSSLNPVEILNNNKAGNAGFVGCFTAVNVDKCDNGSVYVRNNDFNDFDNGIGIFNMNKSASVTVKDNRFNCDASGNPLSYNALGRYGSTAINVQSLVQNVMPCAIDSNIISGSRIGIHLRNLKGNPTNVVTIGNSSVPGNKVHYIDIPVNPLTYGYWFENCDNIRVYNNSVIHNALPTVNDTTKLRGYAVDNTSQSLFCGNYAKWMGSGMRVANTCQGTMFKTSTLDSCYNGFLLYNAELPHQVHKVTGTNYALQNKWPGFSIDIDGNTKSKKQLLWYYDLTSCSDCIPNNISSDVLPVSVANHEGCVSGAIPDINIRNDWFSGIALDTSTYNAFTTENRYQDLEYFYSYALENDTILNLGGNDSIYVQLYDSLESTNIGAFAIVDGYLVAEDFSSASEFSQGLIPANDFETNSQLASEILSDVMISGNPLDEDQIALLEEIAYTNVIHGGKAVYLARALLRIDVDEVEDNVSARIVEQQEIVQRSIKGLVVPNPAQDMITYYYTIEENQAGQFEIRDIMGRILVQKVIYGRNNNESISVNTLAAGIYQYQTVIGDIKADGGRLIIIK